MTDADLPPIDPTRHYPETRKRTMPGRWHPWCPKCSVQWPRAQPPHRDHPEPALRLHPQGATLAACTNSAVTAPGGRVL